MPRPRKPHTHQEQPTKQKTPTFLLELPLAVTPGQARRLRARLEAARQLYNAVLSEGQRRLRHMRADPAWQKARAIPRAQKRERTHAFAALRQAYGFSEYALHDAAQGLNCSWIATHVDAVLAQTLASRAYRALNRVCLGQARRVRFRSRSRGISSVENKRHASQWAFAEVRRFLEYKAVLSGSLCVKVDADYTSQACPHCGYISRENRPKKGLLLSASAVSTPSMPT